ncbi:hypothetical protein, partial [Microbacterium sp. BF1]|uniref:hypothetical protein n=1 Tax=Microbacterium sp. BF1 TaxID=2821146 RepID=UPI001C4DF9B0
FGCDGRVSASIRNARSRISGEYFLFIVFHPCLKNGTKVRPIHQLAQVSLCVVTPRTKDPGQTAFVSHGTALALKVPKAPELGGVSFQRIVAFRFNLAIA